MDFKDIVAGALQESLDDLRNALDGLTDAERRFQPAPHSNHIDFLVWHLARVEDDWVHRFAQRATTMWQQDGWYRKLGLPEKESGFRYTPEQAAALPSFDFGELMEYYAAVRSATLAYLSALKPEQLELCPQPERRPGMTIAQMWGHVIVEASQHTGQVAYLRGVQRGAGR